MANWKGRVQLDYYQEVAEGNVAEHESIHKFGANDNITTTYSDVWNAGTAITYLTTADTVHLISTDANDNQAGTGARSVHIYGLDANFAEQNEVLNMNATDGTVAGPSTANTYIRIYRLVVEDCGVYGGSNAGDISLIADTGASVQGYIATGESQSQTTLYTVPAGKSGYVKRVSISVETGKVVDVKMIMRADADVITAPYTPERDIHFWNGLDTPVEEVFFAFTILPEKTDIHFEALVSVGTAKVEVDYDLVISSG